MLTLTDYQLDHLADVITDGILEGLRREVGGKPFSISLNYSDDKDDIDTSDFEFDDDEAPEIKYVPLRVTAAAELEKWRECCEIATGQRFGNSDALEALFKEVHGRQCSAADLFTSLRKQQS